jgi:IS605 OrfB family transposase
LENLAHQISKAIAVYLHKTGHNKVFVGNNLLKAKNGANLGNKNNQNFIQIPYRLFIDKLKHMLKWFGISLVKVDESWTSKSSCVSDDILKIQRKFRNILKIGDNKEKSKQLGILKNSMLGVRYTRNLFKDAKINKVLHSDVNGAFNILKIGLKKKKIFDNLNSNIMKKLCNPIKNNIFTNSVN